MTKENNILDQIKKADDMGYKATVRYGGERNLITYQIVAITKKGIFAVHSEVGIVNEIYPAENWEIIGYKYGAELCGSGEIPEGQKFRVKNTGKVYKSKPITKTDESYHHKCLILLVINGHDIPYDKSELEPVFD